MSSFNCEHCGKACIDTDQGYVTGCEHYPADLGPQSKPKPRPTWADSYRLVEDAVAETKKNRGFWRQRVAKNKANKGGE